MSSSDSDDDIVVENNIPLAEIADADVRRRLIMEFQEFLLSRHVDEHRSRVLLARISSAGTSSTTATLTDGVGEFICIEASCTVCENKNRISSATRFSNGPPRLKQQILVSWVYKFYLQKQREKLKSIPLPELLQAELLLAYDELSRWLNEYEPIVGKAVRCYFKDLIWFANETRIDDRRTAERMLENMSFDLRKRFLLAAHNCIREKIFQIWNSADVLTRANLQNPHFRIAVQAVPDGAAAAAVPVEPAVPRDDSDFGDDDQQALDAMEANMLMMEFQRREHHLRLHRHARPLRLYAQPQPERVLHLLQVHHATAGAATSSTISPTDPFNPVVLYWLALCKEESPEIVKSSLSQALTFAINQNNLEVIAFCVREIKSTNHSSADLAYIFDHAFHNCLEKGNKPAAYLLWKEANPQQHDSMISAASCCGTKNEYFAFACAVSRGFFDLVNFMWLRTDDNQHNQMLLASHCQSFIDCASKGFFEIAQLLWNSANKNQKFLLMFEQNCAAFRGSCANGHLNIIRLIWQDATPEFRRQLLTVSNDDAIRQAATNGRLAVFQFFVDEKLGVEDGFKKFFTMRCLGCAVCFAAAAGQFDLTRYLLMSYDGFGAAASCISRFLTDNNAEVFELAVARAETTKNWAYLSLLLSFVSSTETESLETTTAFQSRLLQNLTEKYAKMDSSLIRAAFVSNDVKFLQRMADAYYSKLQKEKKKEEAASTTGNSKNSTKDMLPTTPSDTKTQPEE